MYGTLRLMSLKSVLSGIFALALLVTIFYLGACSYIAYKLTIPPESPLLYDKAQIGRGTDVVFRSSDNLQLAGWYFPGTNGKAIMFVHGAGNQNRVNEVYGTPEIAKYFLDQGYTILLFDLRGTGESTKTRLSFGQYEKNDVIGAFEYLKTQDFEPESIGIISDSLGAIATILAAEGVSESGGIVLDSPAAEVKEIVSHIMEDENNVSRLLHPGVYFMAKTLYKIDVNAVRPIDYIEKLSQTPLLFLHGEADTLMHPSHSERLLEKVENGRLVVFPNTKHVETYLTHPELYKEEVDAFFEENLQ